MPFEYENGTLTKTAIALCPKLSTPHRVDGIFQGYHELS